MKATEEGKRLEQDYHKKKHWRRWGPYLAERQWGTVREDYSYNGDAWRYFPFDQAKSRAYRWGEDGIAGLSDNHQRICFAWGFWNEQDPILKERLFGLANGQGNHGEDVKECYYYLDNTPTHAYMKYLYKYPQQAFPYEELVRENRHRDCSKPEYELLNTKAFEENRYFDLTMEYAKEDAEDVCIRLTVENRGSKQAPLHILAHLWFRNTWSWDQKTAERPKLSMESDGAIKIEHPELDPYYLYFEENTDVLFTENDTNMTAVFGQPQPKGFYKDAFDERIVHGRQEVVNPEKKGTKSAVYTKANVPANQTVVYRYRLINKKVKDPFSDFEKVFEKRIKEANAFYDSLLLKSESKDMHAIQRQAFAGLLWNKQYYHYIVERWLKGDDQKHPPPEERKRGRNAYWKHVFNDDILSVPDKWEYPWYASWDTAFHTIPLALVDIEFAKKQLTLFTREWYMHPNGHIPSYEWNFSDVNPPVHAWAAWRLYKISQRKHANEDRNFLSSIFQKLLLNFTWWVNRKDSEGKNVFRGGFLGLDNISLFNRSEDLPEGGSLTQSDATSWMGMFCLNMWTIALELAPKDPSYEDMASKFFEHFLYIADAINYQRTDIPSLWNEEDGFYYDILHHSNGSHYPIKVRSMVGLIPLLAVATLEQEQLNQLPGFKRRFEWFLQNRKDLCQEVACIYETGVKDRHLLSFVNTDRLKRILGYLLDENEFLSPYGIRSLSKYHLDHPYSHDSQHGPLTVGYEPAESSSQLFGGNSNWRGPIWYPLNFLLIEALQKYHHYYGDDFKVECPTGSGQYKNLWEVASEISRRLIKIFEIDETGHRPVFGKCDRARNDPYFKDHLLFYEYFHGDTGEGLGASHQTGWTALVAKLIQQQAGQHD